MRKLLVFAASLMVFGIGAFLSAQKKEDPAIRIKLVDADTGAGLLGIIRIFPKDGPTPKKLALIERFRGIDSETVVGWHVVPADGGKVSLPKGSYRVEAMSGLETALSKQEFELTDPPPAEVEVKLKNLFRPDKHGLVAGNTHLHLRGRAVAGDACNDYLRQIPPGDGLKVLFISYLERVKKDADYATNRYPIGNLEQFGTTGMLVNNGEEHRHNFGAQGQGYGHVMLLDIKEMIKPVSIGPGLTGGGVDDQALGVGITQARGQEGTVIWCHNTMGHEAIVNALAGRLDAFNLFDGQDYTSTQNYEDKYYRFLNVGLRLPISTGTDWMLYDFSRVYARVPDKLTIKSWLGAVKAGRTVATNGPLLTLTVDGKDIGDVRNLDKPTKVRIEAKAVGRQDFQKLQLVQNGKVIDTVASAPQEGGFNARIDREVLVDAPAWFAVRIDCQIKNELNRRIHAHSSPVYLDYAGKRVMDVDAAQGLLKYLEAAQADIKVRGKFSTPDKGEALLTTYAQAVKELNRRIEERGK